MAEYKCFHCGELVPQNLVRKSVRCTHCGSKILFKTRSITKVVKAR